MYFFYEEKRAPYSQSKMTLTLDKLINKKVINKNYFCLFFLLSKEGKPSLQPSTQALLLLLKIFLHHILLEMQISFFY